MTYLAEITTIRSIGSRWAIACVSGVVFLFGVLWHHPGLLGGGAAVLCLVMRSMGENSERRRTSEKRTQSTQSLDNSSDEQELPVEQAEPSTADTPPAGRSHSSRAPVTTDALVDEMLTGGRYSLLLRSETSKHLAPLQFSRAVRMLDQAMALVPGGNVLVGQRAEQSGGSNWPTEMDSTVIKTGLAEVGTVYMDRYTVTNLQFQQFVDAGGYEQLEYWPEEALPALLDFVDQSGEPGPRFWAGGHFPASKDRLPVVGVSWYEACAYARWVGKRLPTEAEWTKASAWPVESVPGRVAQRRYPWGESFDVHRANLWGTGRGHVAPVEEFPTGVSVGGIHQLIGNVWEWTASYLRCSAEPSLHVPETMKSIRGGAFDTYFENQATCHFQSGEFPLARRPNIGFRLALSMSDLEPLAPDRDATPAVELATEEGEMHAANGELQMAN